MIKNIEIVEILKVIVLLVVIFVLVSFDSINLNVTTTPNERTNTINISGEAERQVSPDTAKISFSVNEYNKSQKEAAKIVNEKIAGMIESISDLNVEKKDIKTTNYSVSPIYTYEKNSDGTRERKFSNYRVSQSVDVVIRDLDVVSKVLAKIVEQKVDNVNGPNFYTDNMDGIMDELRGEAIENAQKKAKVLAKELGIELKKVVNFSEGGYAPYRAKFSSSIEMASLETEESDMYEPEIYQGQEKISKSVYITFEIKN